MTLEKIKTSIAYCGLICLLCSPDGNCDCRIKNRCSKKNSQEGCFQYECCNKHGYSGCWQCPDAPCDKDMFTPAKPGQTSSRRKLRAFITCIKEDGLDAFAQYIMKNTENGIVYHRNGVYGDYDLETEEDILHLLRTGG